MAPRGDPCRIRFEANARVYLCGSIHLV
jgi:hypothetical protein